MEPGEDKKVWNNPSQGTAPNTIIALTLRRTIPLYYRTDILSTAILYHVDESGPSRHLSQ